MNTSFTAARGDMQNDDLIDTYRTQIETHNNWLASWPVLQQAWTRRLNSSTEGAICEAILRDELSQRVQHIRPAEDPSAGGPDFKCIVGNESYFVECTCLEIDTVTQATSLPHPPHEGAQSFGLLTDQFREKCSDKTPQLSKADGPRILAICTLHFDVGVLCMNDRSVEFLLTDPQIGFKLNTLTGTAVGDAYQVTNLGKTSFTKPDKFAPHGFAHVRRSVSAVLLCGFGYYPRSMIGALHPEAARPFDSALLPTVKFGTLVYSPQTSEFSVHWTP